MSQWTGPSAEGQIDGGSGALEEQRAIENLDVRRRDASASARSGRRHDCVHDSGAPHRCDGLAREAREVCEKRLDEQVRGQRETTGPTWPKIYWWFR
jgi:hypothetical protein